MKLRLLLLSAFAILSLKGQEIHRVDPPNWWLGHPMDTVEVLIKGKGLEGHGLSVPKEAGEVLEWGAYGSQYLWVQFRIKPSFKGQSFPLSIGDTTVDFSLLERNKHRPLGLSDRDLVYLITPDRFHNGDPTNDDVPGMREQGVNRAEPYARHGGDLKGVQMGLDYVRGLGATAVWLNPVLENDMERDSYHGYAITDHYAVDKRYGGNEAMAELVEAMHEKGLKHVMDIVYNHWGSAHYLHQDLPDSAMVHWNEDGSVPYSSFRFAAMTDPYARSEDVHRFEKGWFAGAMPDLNQEHPLVKSYLKYSTLWYVEMFDVDALRCDTYAFSHPNFLADLNRTLKRVYPELFIFGETWAYSEASQLYFAPNDAVSTGWTGNDAVTDFTLWRAIHQMYGADESEQFGWASGAGALYYRLAADYLYERPEDLVIFLDNHDDGRFLGQHGLDTAKLKSALQLLYSMRGIPVLYYGTELGMSGHENHGAIREDMPGFSGDFPDYTKIGGDLLSLCQELGASRAERGSTSIVQHVPEQGMYVLDLESENGSERLVVNATDREQRYERDGLSIVLKAWEARTIRMELDTHESNH